MAPIVVDQQKNTAQAKINVNRKSVCHVVVLSLVVSFVSAILLLSSSGNKSSRKEGEVNFGQQNTRRRRTTVSVGGAAELQQKDAALLLQGRASKAPGFGTKSEISTPFSSSAISSPPPAVIIGKEEDGRDNEGNSNTPLPVAAVVSLGEYTTKKTKSGEAAEVQVVAPAESHTNSTASTSASSPLLPTVREGAVAAAIGGGEEQEGETNTAPSSSSFSSGVAPGKYTRFHSISAPLRRFLRRPYAEREGLGSSWNLSLPTGVNEADRLKDEGGGGGDNNNNITTSTTPPLRPKTLFEATQQCLAGSSSLFIGHSHVDALGVAFGHILGPDPYCKSSIIRKWSWLYAGTQPWYWDATEGFPGGITWRRSFDPFFSLKSMGKPNSRKNAKHGVNKFTGATADQSYHNIFAGSYAWDLIYRNTHPDEVYRRTLAQLKRLVAQFANGTSLNGGPRGRPNNLIIFQPHYHRKPTWKSRVPCQANETRLQQYALANEKAAFDLQLYLGVEGEEEQRRRRRQIQSTTTTTPTPSSNFSSSRSGVNRSRMASAVNIIMLDIYRWSKQLPDSTDYRLDQQHLNQDHSVEVAMATILNPKANLCAPGDGARKGSSSSSGVGEGGGGGDEAGDGGGGAYPRSSSSSSSLSQWLGPWFKTSPQASENHLSQLWSGGSEEEEGIPKTNLKDARASDNTDYYVSGSQRPNELLRKPRDVDYTFNQGWPSLPSCESHRADLPSWFHTGGMRTPFRPFNWDSGFTKYRHHLAAYYHEQKYPANVAVRSQIIFALETWHSFKPVGKLADMAKPQIFECFRTIGIDENSTTWQTMAELTKRGGNLEFVETTQARRNNITLAAVQKKVVSETLSVGGETKLSLPFLLPKCGCFSAEMLWPRLQRYFVSEIEPKELRTTDREIALYCGAVVSAANEFVEKNYTPQPFIYSEYFGTTK